MFPLELYSELKYNAFVSIREDSNYDLENLLLKKIVLDITNIETRCSLKKFSKYDIPFSVMVRDCFNQDELNSDRVVIDVKIPYTGSESLFKNLDIITYRRQPDKITYQVVGWDSATLCTLQVMDKFQKLKQFVEAVNNEVDGFNEKLKMEVEDFRSKAKAKLCPYEKCLSNIVKEMLN